MEAMSQMGSSASIWSSADYFRSSPRNGHRQVRSPSLKGAIGGHQQRHILQPCT